MAASIGRATRRSSMVDLSPIRRSDKPPPDQVVRHARSPPLSTVDLCHSSWVPFCATSARRRRRCGCRPTRRQPSGCSTAETRTFEVAGHHYALVLVTGLQPDEHIPYQVHVDGELVWPPSEHAVPGEPDPHPRTGHRHPQPDHLRLVPLPQGRRPEAGRRAWASTRWTPTRRGCPAARREEWPDALLLLGDQVYADELTPQNRRRIAGRRDRHPEWPDDEIVGFDEYVGLYQDSWSDPEVRWLLSTVPTAMIFDDHDVRDDWNTSAAWRAQMQREAVVARPDPVRDGLLLGLPAPGQPLRRTSWPPTRTTTRSSATAGTPGRCWSSWPTAPTPRPTAARGCGSASAGISGTAVS